MTGIFNYADIDTSESQLTLDPNPQGKSPEELHEILRQAEATEAGHQEWMEKTIGDTSAWGYARSTWGQESIVAAAVDQLEDFSQVYDPKFDASQDVPEEWPEWAKRDLRSAVNPTHHQALKERIEGQIRYETQGEYFGGPGVAVNIASMIAHPETLLMGVGETAALAKIAGASRLAKFGAGAAIGAGSNMTQELAIMANNKSRTKLGLIMAGATGAGLGGVLSAIGPKGLDDAVLAERVIAEDYAAAVGMDFDIASGKQPLLGSSDAAYLSEATLAGHMAKDPVTGEWVMALDKTAISYPTKAQAIKAYRLAREEGKFDTVSGKVIDPETPLELTDDMVADLDKVVPRQKAYSGWLKSIGTEGMASENPVTRALHWNLVEYAPGTGGKQVAPQTAVLMSDHYSHILRSNFHPVRLESIKDWKVRNAKRVTGPWDTSHDAMFDKAVIEELTFRRYPKTRAKDVEVDPAVKRMADAYEKTEAMRFQMMKDSGVRGYADMDADPLHYSHKWDPIQLNRMAQATSPDFVKRVIQKAILEGKEFERMHKYARLGDKLTDEYKERTAYHMADAIYERMIRRPNTVNEARATHLTKKDRKELERRLQQFIDNPEDLKHVMTAASDKDSRLMHEYMSQIEMNINTEIDGIRVLDMLNTDLGATIDSTFRRSAGQAAMAKKGFKDQSDFLDAVEKSGQWWMKNRADKGQDFLEAETKKLQQLWNVVLGENLERDPESKLTRFLRGLRRAATITSMNQVGAAQFAEFGRVMGSIGARTYLKQVPQLAAMRRKMLNGQYSDPILRDIEAAFGIRIGDNHLLHHPALMADAGGYGLSSESSHAFTKMLDSASAKGMHLQGYINGMNMVTRMQHRMHARGFFMRLADDLEGEIKPGRLKRYADIGLSADDLKVVAQEMKAKSKYTTGWFGQNRIDNVNLINFEPNIREKLALAFHKSQAQAVQRNLGGESGWFMESTFGKLMAQFRNFPIVALEKQTIHDLKFMDAEAFITATAGFGFAATAYMAKTYANSFGLDKKKRKKYMKNRLSPAMIGLGATRWMGQASVLPEAFDIGGAIGFYNPYQYTNTKGMRSRAAKEGLDFGGFLGPGASYADSFYVAAKGIGHAVYNGQELTDNTFRNATRLIPYSNAFGVRNFINYLGSQRR